MFGISATIPTIQGGLYRQVLPWYCYMQEHFTNCNGPIQNIISTRSRILTGLPGRCCWFRKLYSWYSCLSTQQGGCGEEKDMHKSAKKIGLCQLYLILFRSDVVVTGQDTEWLQSFTETHVITEYTMQLVFVEESQPVDSILQQNIKQ